MLEETAIQREMVLEQELRYQQRLERVAHPILNGAVPPGKDRIEPRIGVNISNVYAYERNYRDAAREAFSLDGRIQLIDVTPGSAAFRAGLEAGGRPLKISRRDVADKKTKEDTSRALSESKRACRTGPGWQGFRGG